MPAKIIAKNKIRIIMKKLIIPSLILTLFFVLAFSTKSNFDKGKRALIYTKSGEGYIHKNIPTSIKALEEICKAEGILTDASEDPAVFTDENLKKYDILIFSNTNNKIFDTEEQKKALQKYIRNGGGYVGIHSASGGQRDWPWYWALVGGKFVRHPPYQKFDVVITDKNHPSTSFLGEKWKVEDECYFSNQLNPDINILLSADLTTIEDEKKSEYPSDTFGNYFPLCWSHEFDGGRQWYTALGHDTKTYNDPTFRKHLRGGILWVLCLEK